MSGLTDDYEYYVEQAKPHRFPGTDVDWEEYARLYDIPEDGLAFLREYPSFSAYGGRLLVGDPGKLAGVLPLIFGADPDLHHRDTIAIGYSSWLPSPASPSPSPDRRSGNRPRSDNDRMQRLG